MFLISQKRVTLPLMTLALCLMAQPSYGADEPAAAAHDVKAAVEGAVHTTEHGETAHGEGEHAKPPLLPPLSGPGSQQTYYQALWTIIIFVILLAILYPTAWKNILDGLKKREDRIRGDIAEAEAARSKAQASLQEYNQKLASAESQVQALLAKAVADAEKVASGIRMRGQQEAEEIKERAIKEIDSSKQQALTEIYEQTANLSTSIAEKILRRNLNADDQRELVNESLRQLQAI